MLKQGGRIAGFVIHTPTELTPAQEDRAAELGPSDVTASASPAALAREAGFAVTFVDDVTDQFRSTCDDLLRARVRLEDELRAEEGDAVYEEERDTKAAVRLGIDEGLLLRSLIVAVKK